MLLRKIRLTIENKHAEQARIALHKLCGVVTGTQGINDTTVLEAIYTGEDEDVYQHVKNTWSYLGMWMELDREDLETQHQWIISTLTRLSARMRNIGEELKEMEARYPGLWDLPMFPEMTQSLKYTGDIAAEMSDYVHHATDANYRERLK